MSAGVVVTGATTPIGRALVLALLERSHDTQVFAVVPPGERHDFRVHDRLRVLPCDLRRPRSVSDLVQGAAREHGATTVVHSALHRGARDSGHAIHNLNVESTREMLRLAEGHETIRRFILISHAQIYRTRSEDPSVIEEDHPLDLSPEAPQWLRDRVEADLIVCVRMGMTPLQTVVLRCAECVAPDMGSQLYDFLQSRVCFRPLGFDPIMNLISLADLSSALFAAVSGTADGIFNIAGADTLPLSEIIRRCGRVEVPVPGPLLSPIYGLRAMLRGTDFRYDQNAWRFHHSGALDGRRAQKALGYQPKHPIDWRQIAAHEEG